MKKTVGLLLLTVFILLSFLLVGCDKSIKPQSKSKPPKAKQEQKTKQESSKEATILKPGDFFPIKAGSSWEYEGEGNEFASFSRKILFTDGNISQIREDNGGSVSQSVFKITPDAVTRTYFKGEAYGNANYLNSEPNDNTVILKSPLEVGTKWSDKIATREIVDTNASASTPAGDFTQCLKIRISDKNSTIYEYYKNGVGLVYREFITEGIKITSSLKKFTEY